jgi:hypothetical protein
MLLLMLDGYWQQPRQRDLQRPRRPLRRMEEPMNEAAWRVLSAAEGLLAVLGSRPPTSPILSGARLVGEGGAAA